MVNALLVLFGICAISGAIGVVTSQRPARAAVYLVVTLAAVAACYLVLTAAFVAWVQLLLYAGAVVVLLAFVTMMTTNPVESAERDHSRLPAACIAGGSLVALLSLLAYSFRDSYVDLQDPPSDATQRIGAVIFNESVLAFEILSLLLLAALVGAIFLTRRADNT